MSSRKPPDFTPASGSPGGEPPDSLATPCELSDGTRVVLRPIRPADEALMVRFHESLSDDSVYFRYFGPLKLSQRVAHSRLEQICAAELEHGVALVAEARIPGTGVAVILGVGRFVKSSPGNPEAEFALVVGDGHQGAGLGTRLLRQVIEIARQAGETRLAGYILPGNRPMLHLAEKLGFRRSHEPGDPVVKVELELGPAST